ncbi:exoenzymes regulatory protein aepa precursor [hydrocarbon metagenome]|uniref:Exoenzymes regulatory protein aepa n=1 Tax=hydrocarbon metagenome TaxID=938273 RepID=A0A0W8FZT1_9ZZZZ
MRGTHAVNTLLNNGIKVCLGSDWTVTHLNVINGIDIAVNRTTKDDANPDGWIPSEKISVEEAIKAYTIDAAYASFEEDIKGSIEVGKLADFIVLSENIYEIPSDRINEVKVEKTILAGCVAN